MKYVKQTRVRKKGKVYEYAYFRPPTRHGKSGNLVRMRSADASGEVERLLAEFLRLSQQERRAALSEHACMLVRMAKTRAKLKKVPFDLDQAAVAKMIEDQDYRCEVTGIPFDLWQTGRRAVVRRMPMRPSLDRREPRDGYVIGNVRIICTAANMALNEWGDDVFELIAEGLLRTKRSGRLENRLENSPNAIPDAS